MYVPSIFGVNRFDDFFDISFPELRREPGGRKHASAPCGKPGGLMKTDIKEVDGQYELSIDLPGYRKDELSVKLDKGVLEISASKASEKEEGSSEEKYLRRERFYGSVSRSFYVGENVSRDDISAKYENGILSVTVPKEAAEPVETAQNIVIA